MSTENQPPDDRELTGFLVGTSPASRNYRKLDRPESPPELDQVILRMAQEEFAKPAPAIVRLPRVAARWRVPLALAATLVLSLSTVLLIREDHSASRKALLEAEAPPAAPAAAVADMPAPAPLQQVAGSSASLDASPALPPAPAKPKPEAKSEASSEPKAKAAEQARAIASQRQDEASRRKEEGPAMRGNLSSAPAAKDTAAQDLLDKRAVPMETQKPDASFAKKQVEERVYTRRAPPETEADRAPETSAGAAVGQMQAAPAAPAAAFAPAPQRDEFRQKSSASPASSAYSDSVYATPEQWLPRIRDLRDHGLTEEASRQLRAFIGIYPEYLLPDDLRPLLN